MQCWRKRFNQALRRRHMKEESNADWLTQLG